MHELLEHLEHVGFDGAPRFAGIDEGGREVLSWIEGQPATRPWPPELLTEDGVAAMARLLRRYHDAVRAFRPSAGAEWWIGVRPPAEDEIICHGDLGPWNTIWRDGEPVAFIDWDFAEPASPLVDVAEMAFFIAPMAADPYWGQCGFASAPDRARRLRVFCEAYGDVQPAAVVAQALRNWEEDTARIAEFGPAGIAPWDGFLKRGMVKGNREFVRWLREHAEELD